MFDYLSCLVPDNPAEKLQWNSKRGDSLCWYCANSKAIILAKKKRREQTEHKKAARRKCARRTRE